MRDGISDAGIRVVVFAPFVEEGEPGIRPGQLTPVVKGGPELMQMRVGDRVTYADARTMAPGTMPIQRDAVVESCRWELGTGVVSAVVLRHVGPK